MIFFVVKEIIMRKGIKIVESGKLNFSKLRLQQSKCHYRKNIVTC